MALVVLISLACNLPGQVATSQEQKPIPVTTEAVAQAQQQVEQAATQIANNQPITVEFTEEQLTSIAVYSLQSEDNPPLQDPQIRLRGWIRRSDRQDQSERDRASGQR